MTEKREWWSDDLIEAVRHMIQGFGYDALDEITCGVIAAVEDWHRDRWTGVCESPEEVVRELKQAQAAIQRVRELRDRFRDHEKWVSYRNVETLLTHALEGDA